MSTAEEVVQRLEALVRPGDREGMARFGIDIEHALGVRIPAIRGLGRELGTDHQLALALWRTGIHEARILASMVDAPARVTEAQMERWARDFASWDVCDQVCGNLFDRTPFARDKAIEWSAREEEFVKRAGFALVAWRAVHVKDGPDAEFSAFLKVIEREAADPRNFVKKAVSWALRQIGKRSASLHPRALTVARRLAARKEPAARWVGRDAQRELESQAVLARIR